MTARKELVLVPTPALVRLPLLTVDAWLEDTRREPTSTTIVVPKTWTPRRDRSPATQPGYGLGRPNRNRGKKFPATPPTNAEMLRILALCGKGKVGRRNHALLCCLWRSGLRVSEALALKPYHVNYDDHTVTVESGKTAGNRTLTSRYVRRRREQDSSSLTFPFICRSPREGRRMAKKRGPKIIPWQVRFWRFVPADRTPTDCWEWQGRINENGYGYIGRGGGGAGSLRAHRASYELHFGAIPDGLMVCHRCDNRACVNPAHLFAASQGDNLRDMVRKGRAGAGVFRPGDDHPTQRFSDADVRAMRELAAEGVSYVEIGERFGIDRFYLSMLVRGRGRVAAGGPIRGAA